MRSEVQIFPDPPNPLEVLNSEQGAIAQLGERLPCTQEVGGSIPPGSTIILIAVAFEFFKTKRLPNIVDHWFVNFVL